MDDDAHGLPPLLKRWVDRGGQRLDLLEAVRGAMNQGARQGLARITSDVPDAHVVEDVVTEAFCELESKDLSEVRSVPGLAKVIAFRRGQDAGRRIVRARERMKSVIGDSAYRTSLEFSDDDVRTATDRETLAQDALECLETLPEDQQSVIRANILEGQHLSDWAMNEGKSHQAAGRQRTRALKALRRCVEAKRRFQQDLEGGADE